MRLRFRKVPPPAPRLWAPGTGWPRRGAAQSRTRRGWAGGARAAEELRGARPAGSPAAHLERSGRTWAGRGAGAQARDPASPLPTSPAGAHLGDSQRKRSLGRRLAWQRGRPGGQAGSGGGGGGVEPNGPRESQPPESPAPPPALGSGPAGSAPGRPPLPAACPAHLPGKPARSRRGPRDPGEGQAAGRPPEAARGRLDPVSRAGFSCPPSGAGEAGGDTGHSCRRCPSAAPGAKLQPECSTRTESPSDPGLVLGKADLRRRRWARLANLG